MKWFKIELTDEQVKKNEHIKIEKIIDNNDSFSTSSKNNPKTIYFSSTESELKNTSLTEFSPSPCSEP